ncbi:MAG: hypothetical protein AB1397_06085 [bacterium]
MKRAIFGILMILTFPAYCSLTKQDIEEIRKIVKEEVQGLRQEMNTRINDLDEKLTSRIDSLQNLLYVILYITH